MPSRSELVAYNRTLHEISSTIGADRVIFQELTDLVDSVLSCAVPGSKLTGFDTSVFDGMLDPSCCFFQKTKKERKIVRK